jgi:hypothetical protein
MPDFPSLRYWNSIDLLSNQGVIMTSRFTALAAISLAALVSAPASAQTIKPGLYQITSKMSGNNEMGKAMAQQKEAMAKMTPEQRKAMADMPRQMEKMMADMPPAQRKAMKDMMAKQGKNMDAMQSMQVETNADGSTSMKMCMTKEMVDRNQFGANQQGNCKHNTGKFSGGVMKFSYVCTQPVASGEGEVRVTGPSSYSTKMKMVHTDRGQKQVMEVESNSTWLGANCGSVKPLDLKPQ